MAIYRIKRLFSKKEEENAIKSGAAAVGAAGILATTKTGRLTGKVVRYHNTENKNVQGILENGILSKYATDPDNITNKVLKHVPMEEKEGLVYTAKKKSVADSVGLQRERLKSPWAGLFPPSPGDLKKWKDASKTLKLEFDYDQIKNLKKEPNPELLGANSFVEFKKRFYETHPKIEKSLLMDINLLNGYKSLGKDTHVFRGDIKPENIVGGKGYKKRTAKQTLKYIKNNPGRFGKEAAKVGVGVGLGSYAIKKAVELNGSKKK